MGGPPTAHPTVHPCGTVLLVRDSAAAAEEAAHSVVSLAALTASLDAGPVQAERAA